jgi:cyclase
MQEKGVGEIIVQSIENDGVMKGYDINLIRKISASVTIPVVALGGAGNLNHMKSCYTDTFANGLAAGSMFVYHGSRNAVLINYPGQLDILNLFK